MTTPIYAPLPDPSLKADWLNERGTRYKTKEIAAILINHIAEGYHTPTSIYKYRHQSFRNSLDVLDAAKELFFERFPGERMWSDEESTVIKTYAPKSQKFPFRKWCNISRKLKRHPFSCYYRYQEILEANQSTTPGVDIRKRKRSILKESFEISINGENARSKHFRLNWDKPQSPPEAFSKEDKDVCDSIKDWITELY